jgi:uncharacterized membrane protein (GlpM family)
MLSSNEAVLTSITIPVDIGATGMVILVSTASLEDNIYMTGIVILVSTASLVDRTSVQQEW